MTLAWTAHVTSLPHLHGDQVALAVVLGLLAALAWKAWRARKLR